MGMTVKMKDYLPPEAMEVCLLPLQIIASSDDDDNVIGDFDLEELV